MKKLLFIALLFIILSFTRCDEKSTLLTGIRDGEKIDEGTQVAFLLGQNYPNPFNHRTVIGYQVAKTIHLRMKVYTEDWQEVKTLFDTVKEPGRYQAQFDGRNSKNELISSGEYFYTLEGDGLIEIRRMKLIK